MYTSYEIMEELNIQRSKVDGGYFNDTCYICHDLAVVRMVEIDEGVTCICIKCINKMQDTYE